MSSEFYFHKIYFRKACAAVLGNPNPAINI